MGACKSIASGIGGGKEYPQFIILGMDAVGKTTLLYKLKFGNTVEADDFIHELKDMRKMDENGKCRDPGYHYEELAGRGGYSFGCWEIPGTSAMRQTWTMFYRAVKMHVCIFVVGEKDIVDGRHRMAVVKKNLHYLMNEDELKSACFCVVFNNKTWEKTPTALEGPGGQTTVFDPVLENNEVYYKLGLHDLHPSCAWRTKTFIFDVMKLGSSESDKEFKKLAEFAKETMKDPKGFGMKF